MQRHTYPVSYEITRPEHYNRWTVGFRLILAIPLLILVGGLSPVAGPAGTKVGPLTALLITLVVYAWFAILFTRRFPASVRDTSLMLFGWTLNISAYLLLLAEPYPPFGSQPYALRVEITPAEQYYRWTVFFRPILAIPHLVVLAFLGIAQAVITIIAWFAILFTGQYPEGMFEFSVGVNRWGARVGAYIYLFVDEYPPFTLAAEPGSANLEAAPA